MSYTNMKNKVGFLTNYDGKTKEQLCVTIGVNTPLFPFVSMLIKMNRINFKKKESK